MGTAMPDPKKLADSVVDGAIEVVEVVPRVAENCAVVGATFAASMKSNMDTVKGQLPDNPAVLPDVAIKAVGQTINAGISLFEGIGKGVMDTADGVKNQIRRVTG